MLNPQRPLRAPPRPQPRIYHRPQKIRPRGLINSGNMCFANSVLQIMLYCPPFHWLFAELRRVLEGSGPSGSAMNGINGVDGTSGNGTAAEASAYPLVEA